jgi:hypothetical protein
VFRFPTTEGWAFGYQVRDGFLHRSGLVVEEWGRIRALENRGPSNSGGDGNPGLRGETWAPGFVRGGSVPPG